eukprot:6213271-Pleurochrysis_carterae.AAC.1
MATQAATPKSVSTPTHRPRGRHTWFHLEGGGRRHGARVVLAGWGATRVRAPRPWVGETMVATTPLTRVAS